MKDTLASRPLVPVIEIEIPDDAALAEWRQLAA